MLLFEIVSNENIVTVTGHSEDGNQYSEVIDLSDKNISNQEMIDALVNSINEKCPGSNINIQNVVNV